ncbi:MULTISPECIES: AAA family ATPase [Rhizobium]|uniref:Overcoming lysogenization defect protein n=1 Tax=Rhizobium favelukesii TaxID=348824 RepID=W6RA10_9HYPH|nr:MULTISPECIES: AAA family ATPase [Rhizobium]MCS0458863.1 AAA family ATPase [Rhizobium favelukesii]UFS80783.1 AAA family ATPase [Rhizobium sp. T136]CDM57759.1 Overcoming lysogenization defect protein [Rhizobium favelukesii]
MRIKKVRLKNGYKRFHDLTIDLGQSPARIVALVGPNGSGKSSVLDGMLYHQQAHGSTGSHSNDDGPTYHFMGDAGNYEAIIIDFVQGSFQEVRSAREKQGKPNTVFSFRSPYRYNNHVKIDTITSTTPIRENNYGARYASALDSKMEQNYRRLQALVNRYMQDNDVRPSEARAKVIGDLNASISKCLDLEITSVGNVEASQGTLYFSKPDSPREFEFNVLSSGEKEVIDLLLDLYLRRDDYDDSVFLIDEPELHINTAIQGSLLTEIDRLVGPDCQIWITTHSIGFLKALQTQMKDRCQIIQFRGDLNLASTVQTLTPLEPSTSAWRDLFAVALDDLATLVAPKTIIYCEGRDAPGKAGSERGMDAQAFNAIFNRDMPDAMFISSGGNTELDQRSAVAIAILSKVFPEIEILVFKDRDMASGKITDENDRQVYLKTNPQNHRVMKRFEIENYLYDKEVLAAYCAANALQFDEASYDNLVCDIVNQNLKDVTGHIKSICGIKGSINAETFKVSLARHVDEGMAAYKELYGCIFNRE